MWLIVCLIAIMFFGVLSVTEIITNINRKRIASDKNIEYWIDYNGKARSVDNNREVDLKSVRGQLIMTDVETIEKRNLTQERKEFEFKEKQNEYRAAIARGEKPRMLYLDRLLTTGQHVKSCYLNYGSFCSSVKHNANGTKNNYLDIPVYYDIDTGMIVCLTETSLSEIDKTQEIKDVFGRTQLSYLPTTKEMVEEMINGYNNRLIVAKDNGFHYTQKTDPTKVSISSRYL